jgi:L-ascorbate metabolism protein UlaG (beta-lactamase superfamily)
MKLVIAILLFLLAVVVIILRFSPTFGANQPARTTAFNHSPQYRQGEFVNTKVAPLKISGRSAITLIKDMVKGHSQSRPHKPLEVAFLDKSYLHKDKRNQAIWLGHSTFLLRMGGKLLLLDPMLGTAPSPLPLVGSKRFSQMPIQMADLPFIDAVLVSHDHYDHLDYGTIRKLKDRVGHFFVPLGVGSHLQRWGVSAEKISECDWWDECSFESLQISCTPARHFSGRNINNRNSTLWCSWVIIDSNQRVFFSGDGSYGPHFREIGKKYGPFDLTLMECGQYDRRWSASHMMPERTVQAHRELKGKVLLPMHWAAFVLAVHSWNEPIERVTRAAMHQEQEVATPRIGEPVIIGDPNYARSAWWREDYFS